MLSAYAILFALIFVAAWVFVPSGHVQSTLKHSVGVGEYPTLAWLETSLATVTGALRGQPRGRGDGAKSLLQSYRQRRRREDDSGHEDEFEGDPAKQWSRWRSPPQRTRSESP